MSTAARRVNQLLWLPRREQHFVWSRQQTNMHAARSVFGASAGWVDLDWAWHRQYDVDYGLPSGPMERVAPVRSRVGAAAAPIYRRRYSKSIVELDCDALAANITML